MSIIDNNGLITVKQTDGTVVMTISDAANWSATLSAFIFEDNDGSSYQWNVGSQSFIQVT